MKNFFKENGKKKKEKRKFSKFALDHNHKQMNAKIKEVGGTISQAENELSLKMVNPRSRDYSYFG